MNETMRVMGASVQGARMFEIPKPIPGKGEVRVKVIASSVNPAEKKVINGDFVGRFLHAKTSPLVLGWDFSGNIDAVGQDVTDIEAGAAVLGHLKFAMSEKQGAFAEYITVPRASIGTKPDTVSYQVAAAAPTVVMTSLQSIRDHGRLQEGGKILIIGAAGGIGAVSVGIGKRLGAHITAVCSTKDVEHVKALGADIIIDRMKSDPFNGESVYDVVFDTPAVHSFGHSVKILRPGGTYVTTLPSKALITGMIRSLFTSKRCRFVQVSSKRADLELVSGWLAEGLEVPIDSQYKIIDLDEALKRQNDRGRVGRVVVNVAEGWQS